MKCCPDQNSLRIFHSRVKIQYGHRLQIQIHQENHRTCRCDRTCAECNMLALCHHVTSCLPRRYRHCNKPDNSHRHCIHHCTKNICCPGSWNIAMIIQKVLRNVWIIHEILQQMTNSTLCLQNIRTGNDRRY